MHHKILSIAFAFAVTSVSAQMVYDSALGIDSVYGQRILMLDNGNLMVAGSKGNGAHLSGWNLNGDTLWTRSYPGTSPGRLQKLSTGEILVGGATSSILVNEYGEDPSIVPVGGRDIIEIGEDSLVSIQWSMPALLRLTDRAGSVIWETEMVVPPDHSPLFPGGILAKYDSGIMLFSEFDGGIWNKHILAKYGYDGTFLDSLVLKNSVGVNQAFLGSIPTIDGGAMIYALNETGCTYLVKTDHLGDTTWTRSIIPFGTSYPEWFRVHGATQLINGHYVLSGYSVQPGSDPTEAAFHLLELDEFGGTVCWESLYGPADLYQSISDVAVDPNGRIHTVMSDRDNWNAVPTFRIVGHEQLCFTTTISEDHTVYVGSVQMASEAILLRTDRPGAHYRIHALSGQIVAEGSLLSDITSVAINRFKAGMYLVTLFDDRTGERLVQKIVVE